MKTEYFFILIILVIKVCRPYFKKQLNGKINENHFLFYNTLTILMLYLLYNLILNCLNIKKFYPSDLITNYIDLDTKSKLLLLLLGLFTLINTMSFFELDNSDDQSKIPIIIKSISTILTIIISCYLNNEEITRKQKFGIILLILGLYVLTTK
jgi:drug/metabolite transporter (DMT)-like permease